MACKLWQRIRNIPNSEASIRTYKSWPPLITTLISRRSFNQMAHPLPNPLISVFANAIQEQFLKHFSLHSLKLMLSLTHEYVVSGNFIPGNFANPTSSQQFRCLVLTHPSV
uniref:Uncharacterized protein n=1 Tax=Cucumis sativus TaxID=3659 RepID=A0A0A0LGC7_CUCSA